MLDMLFHDHGGNLDILLLLKLFVFGNEGQVVSLSVWNMTEARPFHDFIHRHPSQPSSTVAFPFQCCCRCPWHHRMTHLRIVETRQWLRSVSLFSILLSTLATRLSVPHRYSNLKLKQARAETQRCPVASKFGVVSMYVSGLLSVHTVKG